MLRSQGLPDFERLSVLTATILLAYALAGLIEIPQLDLATQLPGLYLAVQVNTNTLIAILVAGLTASGSHWLLQSHPSIQKRRSLAYILLPSLTALVISLLLSSLPEGAVWLVVFTMGGLLLVLVLVAEYLVVDEQDPRHPLAATGLIAISFALFLILAISLRGRGVRLFFLLPALVPAAGLISLRALQLRSPGPWQFLQASAVALAIGHLAAALHYWPLSPIQFGLALLGPAYALTSLLGNLSEGRMASQALVEPGLVLAILVGLALWAG